MRAIVFDQPGDESVLRIGTIPSPAMGPRDLRIRVAASGVNRADLLQRRGLYPPPPGASPLLGLECVGQVVEKGAEVGDEWQAGQRVIALLAGGGYAEQVVVDAGSVLAAPESMSNAQAAGFAETFLTVFANLFTLRPGGVAAAGGAVLVHGGSSGIGTAAITLCNAAGIRVFVTAGSDAKCERCLAHGATAAINYKTASFPEQVVKLTDGRGVDAVLDCVGAQYLEKNIDSLGRGGTLIVIGLMGGIQGSINLAPVLQKNLQICGTTLRSRSNAEKASLVQAFKAAFGAEFAGGDLRPIIDSEFALEQASEAHRTMQASKHFGKLILRVDAS